MTSEELAFVALEGDSVPYSHAVFIETEHSWHVELEDVPVDSCPFVEGRCAIAFDTWDGDHYAGLVTASYKSEGPTYLVLTGVGELERTQVPQAAVVEGAEEGSD
jgi:hypothetical protein